MSALRDRKLIRSQTRCFQLCAQHIYKTVAALGQLATDLCFPWCLLQLSPAFQTLVTTVKSYPGARRSLEVSTADHLLWQATSPVSFLFQQLLKVIVSAKVKGRKQAPDPGRDFRRMQSERDKACSPSPPCSSANHYWGSYNTAPSKWQEIRLKSY